jgi:hypothetical protein
MHGTAIVLVRAEAVETAESDVEKYQSEADPFDDNLLFMAWEQAYQGLYLRKPDEYVGNDAGNLDLHAGYDLVAQLHGVDEAFLVLATGDLECVGRGECQRYGDGEGRDLLQPWPTADSDDRSTSCRAADHAASPHEAGAAGRIADKEGAWCDDEHDDEHPRDDRRGARRIGLRGDGSVERVSDVGDARDAAGAVVHGALLGVAALWPEEGVGAEIDEIAGCQLDNTIGGKFVRGTMLSLSVGASAVVAAILTKGLDWSRGARRSATSQASSSHMLDVYTGPAAADARRYGPMGVQTSDMASRSVWGAVVS